MIYAARFAATNALPGFPMENCCGGASDKRKPTPRARPHPAKPMHVHVAFETSSVRWLLLCPVCRAADRHPDYAKRMLDDPRVNSPFRRGAVRWASIISRLVIE
jgi:hypothetical protein